jgi:transcriptional regulator with PAS, ATPase and Fis domain
VKSSNALIIFCTVAIFVHLLSLSNSNTLPILHGRDQTGRLTFSLEFQSLAFSAELWRLYRNQYSCFTSGTEFENATMMNHHGPPIIGCSPPAERLRAAVAEVASTSLTVMIRGEKGTGKDVVAREIHRKSNRAGGPFIRVNCAALPEELVEGELFGSSKGAYTGAVDRPGKFEQANGGTIFLDEVGELSRKAQPKLLHVTENLTVDRVGGRSAIPVDFRLIVATNRNLEEMVRQGTFADDLYDRLNMFSIWVPPLRERMEDIPLLVDYFIGDCVGEAGRMVTGAAPQVLDLLQKYSWPGNLRELRNIVKRGVFTGKTDCIRQEDLPFDFAQRMASPPVKCGNHDEQLRAFSRQLFVDAVKQCHGNRSRAAALLGLTRNKFYRLLRLHGLDGDSGNNGHDESDWVG